jgi:hypothetical protein
LCGSAQAADHEFRYKAPDANGVELMADFNGWKAVPMTKGSDGVWTTTVSVSPGTHGYKFLVNGKDWMLDPDNPARTKVDGIENSAVEIGGAASPVATATSSNGDEGRGQRENSSQRVDVSGNSRSGAGSMTSTSAKPDLAPIPGEILITEVPVSAPRRADAAKDENPKLAHARMALAVPPGFDPQKSWPVLVVANTEAYSNIDSLRQFKDAALNENWVVLAADCVEAEKNKEGANRWPCIAAAFDYLTAAWPAVKNWPVACGGMSGGAKNSSFLAADLAREHHRVVGMLMMGCNQDMATVAYRKGGAATLLNAAVFISSGKSDTIAKPAAALEVKNSLQGTGFHKVRLESYDGAHDIYQPHIGEALRWFLAQSPTPTPSSSSDFDKFFKKKS